MVRVYTLKLYALYVDVYIYNNFIIISKTIICVQSHYDRYDFAVFGYFSDILGDVFFPPHQDGHAAIIESFAVFGGAFCK